MNTVCGWTSCPTTNPKDPIIPVSTSWYAESLLECYDLTHDRKYLEAAARTAHTYASAQRKDGTMFYDNYINGRPSDKGSVCGSEVALAGILWMRLAEYGFDEFVEHYERSAEWLVKTVSRLNIPTRTCAAL